MSYNVEMVIVSSGAMIQRSQFAIPKQNDWLDFSPRCRTKGDNCFVASLFWVYNSSVFVHSIPGFCILKFPGDI